MQRWPGAKMREQREVAETLSRVSRKYQEISGVFQGGPMGFQKAPGGLREFQVPESVRGFSEGIKCASEGFRVFQGILGIPRGSLKCFRGS